MAEITAIVRPSAGTPSFSSSLGGRFLGIILSKTASDSPLTTEYAGRRASRAPPSPPNIPEIVQIISVIIMFTAQISPILCAPHLRPNGSSSSHQPTCPRFVSPLFSSAFSSSASASSTSLTPMRRAFAARRERYMRRVRSSSRGYTPQLSRDSMRPARSADRISSDMSSVESRRSEFIAAETSSAEDSGFVNSRDMRLTSPERRAAPSSRSSLSESGCTRWKPSKKAAAPSSVTAPLSLSASR